MIDFQPFKLEDGIPIYLQIIRFLKQNIISGLITDQDELPSRRYLSTLLGINPNTVQKAYRMLEDEDLIESRSGAKSYMKLDETKIARVRQELLETEAAASIRSMRQMGLTKEEVLLLVEKYWN